MSTVFANAIAMPDTPEWFAARTRSIGASEAAAVCGLSRYETPMSVYLRKVGITGDTVENAAMRMGKRLEQAIREEWSMLTHQEVDYPIPMASHPDHDCITATPDGLLSVSEGLECKSTSSFASSDLGEDGTDQIHQEWIIQAQQQMAVWHLERVHFAVLVDGRRLRTFVVNRNEKLIAAIVQMDLQMWDRITNRIPPDWDFDNPSTPNEVKAMFSQVSGETVTLGEDAADAWREYRELGEQIKTLDAARESRKAEVLAQIGNAGAGIIESLGIEIVRSEVAACSYEVNRKSYITARERKLSNVKRNRSA